MLAEGFPNMMMVLGPHTARGNIPQAHADPGVAAWLLDRLMTDL
jgi:hypothetical protein